MTRTPCRRSALTLAARSAGIPRYSSDIAPVRGRCRGGTKRKPCPSRWGVTRVSMDFRDPDRVDKVATVECALCGRTWRRVPPVPIRSAAGYQSVHLTLILPATASRWHSRGHWHRTGDDALVLRDADIIEANDAILAHRQRQDNRIAARSVAKAKRDAAEAEAARSTRDLIARIDARLAEEAEAEAAAVAREAR